MKLNIFKEHYKQNKIVFFDKVKFKNKFNKVVVIGAGGSIGKEISKLLFSSEVKSVLFIDNSEINLHNLKNEVGNSELFERDFVIADIRDRLRIDEIIRSVMPDLVIHTAALKHVDLMEANSYEAIRTNVEGTINLFDVCLKNKVKEFIFISTDKAVNSISKMGKSKRIAELYLQSKTLNNQLKLKIVRLGNVIGSSGSIIPLVKKQIKRGIPIVLNHSKLERYFIVNEMAAKLILNVASINSGQNFYLLEMNKPILIKKLIVELIEKYANKEIKIISSKLKKGEKLVEELLSENENVTPSQTPFCWVVNNTSSKVDISQRIIDLVNENKSHNFDKRNTIINEVLNL